MKNIKQFDTSIDVGITTIGVGIRFMNDEGHQLTLDLTPYSTQQLVDALQEALKQTTVARA